MMYIVELHISKSRKRSFYWRVVAQNGQTLLTSETYARRPYAVIKKFCAAFKDGEVEFVDWSKEKKAKKKR